MRHTGSRIAVIMLHGGCNMHCTFCISDPAMTSMGAGDALQLLDRLHGAGFGSIVFGGGEPFVWEHDVVSLAREARRRGFETQAGTNGIALPEDPAALDAFDRFVLPLDAADPALHDRLRRFRGGHHALVVGRLEALRAASREVTVSTVVTAENAAALPAVGAWLDAYAARGGRLHAWHLYKFLPYGRGGARSAARLAQSDAAYHAACAPVRAMPHAFPIYKRPDMRHSRSVDFFWHEGGRLRAGSEAWAGAPPAPAALAQAHGWPCEASA